MTWLAVLAGLFVPAASAAEHLSKPQFQLQAESFSAQEAARGLTSIAERLQFRIHEQPFLLIATILFISFAAVLAGQDVTPPAPPPEKKGGGRGGARVARPGVTTPGVKREMSTVTPSAVMSDVT